MKKWQQNIVLFDLDGTLTDSAEGIIRSVQHMQEKTGREVWEAEKLGFIVGPPLRDSFRDAFGMKTEEEIDNAVAVFRERYFSVGLFENAVYPGVKEMLEELKKMGKKVVTLLFNGRPLALGNIEEYTDALVEAWHLGKEAGSAVCDVLFGDYNPSGRLTATVPYYSGQWPVYYNHPNTGRPTNESEWTCKYRDAPLTPLYCFGYGLSYTEFEYSNLKLETSGDELKATYTPKTTKIKIRITSK